MTEQTERLVEAVCNWINSVLPKLTPEHYKVVEAMFDGRCEVSVVARLREGSIVLKGIDDIHGREIELYRDKVAPFRVMGEEPEASAPLQ